MMSWIVHRRNDRLCRRKRGAVSGHPVGLHPPGPDEAVGLVGRVALDAKDLEDGGIPAVSQDHGHPSSGIVFIVQDTTHKSHLA
jgi:hypothetical protein